MERSARLEAGQSHNGTPAPFEQYTGTGCSSYQRYVSLFVDNSLQTHSTSPPLDLGRLIFEISGEARETSFMYQMISILVQ